MTTGMIDVRKTRTFGIENYLFKQVPTAIGALLLGIFVLALSRGGGSEADKGLFLGIPLIAGSIIYIAYAFHRRAMPKKPLMELSSDGILYRIAQDKEFRIPWNEVQGLGLIDIDLGRGGKLRNIMIACVSQDFFDANVPVKSWWKRGPGWRHNFIPKGDVVQIVFHHDVMSVPAEELWNEIETRWRVLSGHPNAPILPAPRVPKTVTWFGGWTPPPTVRRAGLAVLAVLAPLAIYFWHWPVVWFSSPDVPDGSASFYLQNLLDRGGVQARVEGNGIAILRGSDLSQAGPASCTTEITRDANRSALLPPYFAGTTLCTARLATTAGTSAVAIFKLVVETTQSPDWEGKMQEYRSLAPASLDEKAADAALCRLGYCAAD